MNNRGLASYPWKLGYKTSDVHDDGTPVNILQEFYIPALSLAVRYDRVAGYFRSSSLAAAAMGYSAFIGKHGKMRLIVGADLDPEDVKAILAGDQLRLEQRLNDGLQLDQPLPTEVKYGLTLLSWMIAQDILEVRVAFHLHRDTSQPLPFDSTEDGYVHEKWIIFADEFGQRMYCSGSLNESKTALIINAENLDVHPDWEGGRERERVEKACLDFEELWNNRRSHIPVKTLPEAVRAGLIKLSENVADFFEIDGTPIINPTLIRPSTMELLKFSIIKDAPLMPGGQFVGMYTAPIEPWPHQEIVIRRLIETYPYAFLLCDEVGLGKTIEAGLAIRSLYLSGLAQRILIAAPASLTNQWQREMAYKAYLPFARTTTVNGIKRNYLDADIPESGQGDLYSPDLNIISTGVLARKERRNEIRTTRDFDIVLLDEAHYARRKNPGQSFSNDAEYGQLYQTIQKVIRTKANALWLATATPMQIDPIEVYDLIALTERIGSYQKDPALTLSYFEILYRLVNRSVIQSDEWTILAKTLQQLAVQDPYHNRNIQETSLQQSVVAATVRQLLEGRIHFPPSDWRHLNKTLFSASPLSRVMLRHSRNLLKIYRDQGQLSRKLAERKILPMERITFTTAEKRCYERLEEYCDGLSRQIAMNSSKQTRQMMVFLLSFLRLRFASSLYAIKQTLQRRKSRVIMTLQTGGRSFENQDELKEYMASLDSAAEDDAGESDDLEINFELLLKNRSVADLEWEREKLNEMLADLEHLHERPSKMQKLFEVIQGRRYHSDQEERIRQMVVFTRFMDTLRDIRQNLATIRDNFRVGVYSGSETHFYDVKLRRIKHTNAEEVKKRFINGEIDILLCTDAAAEGLNLQTADLIVNYDLGWNPMKIEQRIGRIDRIGQTHDRIYVQNFCYLNSSEEIVYDRLLTRLKQANLVVGSQQIAMLPIEPEEFRKLDEGKITEAELESTAKKRIKEQQARQQSMEMSAQEQYEMYQSLTARLRQQPLPINLDQIWQTVADSQYMQKLGIKIDPEHEQIIQLSSLTGLFIANQVTISRDLFEKTESIRFLTYGEPALDAILQLLLSADVSWPNCIRRIVIELDSFPGKEMVGYVVALQSNGQKRLELITRMDQLANLTLDESRAISDHDLSPFMAELRRQAEQSLHWNILGLRAGPMNQEASELHFNLLKEIAKNLIIQCGSQDMNERFSTAVQQIESALGANEAINLQIDVLSFRGKEALLLFDLRILPVGDRQQLRIPTILARFSLELAKRTADAAHIAKNELTVAEVIRRLNQVAQ